VGSRPISIQGAKRSKVAPSSPMTRTFLIIDQPR
jgi:hypothetical protein